MTTGNDDIAERLKRLRGLLSPQEVADKLGVSVVSVYRWENREREPKSRILAKYAEVFGTTLDWIQNGKSKDAVQVNEAPEPYGLSRSDSDILRDLKALLEEADDDFKRTIRQQIKLLTQAVKTTKKRKTGSD